MYIDVRLPGFLPRGLSLGEAWRISPCQIREGSLLPIRYSSTNRVFCDKVEHILVEEPAAEEPVVEEPGFEEFDSEMVVR